MRLTHQPKTTIGEEGYLSLLKHIMEQGYKTDDRTGTGTIASPTSHQLFFPNVKDEFPLFTTKKVSFNMLASEMLWFISGGRNTNQLREIGSEAMANMWDKWAEPDGDLGRVYGQQWVDWNGKLNQLQKAIETIKFNPTSRRNIVTAWNPSELDQMALPPCHMTFQFRCEPLMLVERVEMMGSFKGVIVDHDDVPDHIPKYKLHLHLLQRSCDMILGVPFNVAQYALLLCMIAEVTNTIPGGFTWTGVDCHIYQNHTKAVETQLKRLPTNPPKLLFKENRDNINDFVLDDFEVKDYYPQPPIEAKVSV